MAFEQVFIIFLSRYITYHYNELKHLKINDYICSIYHNRYKMKSLLKPKHYKPLLNATQTEQGIKLIKDFFQQNISTELRLRRVTAPLFVLKGLGLNDDLNGVERAVTLLKH